VAKFGTCNPDRTISLKAAVRKQTNKQQQQQQQGSRRVPAGTMKIHKHTIRIYRHNNKNLD